MKNFHNLVNACVDAHQNHPAKPSKSFRKADGETPYSMHPVWCAAMLLAETALPKDVRVRGYQALLFHDVLEDTTAELPALLSAEVKAMVKDMTFASSAEEMRGIWDKPDEIKLLKLYDKVSNLLDGAWMDAQKRETYVAYTRQLCAEVEKAYGTLAIVKIARAIL